MGGSAVVEAWSSSDLEVVYVGRCHNLLGIMALLAGSKEIVKVEAWGNCSGL